MGFEKKIFVAKNGIISFITDDGHYNIQIVTSNYNGDIISKANIDILTLKITM